MSPVWTQPLAPLHSLGLSALAATIPLVVVLFLMGIARKSGLVAGSAGLAGTAVLATALWHMPAGLAGWSLLFGFATAAWSILWLVFNAIWLYNLSVKAGSFDRLRRWIDRRSLTFHTLIRRETSGRAFVLARFSFVKCNEAPTTACVFAIPILRRH